LASTTNVRTTYGYATTNIVVNSNDNNDNNHHIINNIIINNIIDNIIDNNIDNIIDNNKQQSTKTWWIYVLHLKIAGRHRLIAIVRCVDKSVTDCISHNFCLTAKKHYRHLLHIMIELIMRFQVILTTEAKVIDFRKNTMVG
jgi:hypothetical protein